MKWFCGAIFSPAYNIYATKIMIVEIELLFTDALIRVNKSMMLHMV